MTGMLAENWSIPNFAPMEFIPSTVHLTIYDSDQVRSSHNVFQDFIHAVEAEQIKLPIGQVVRLDDIVNTHQLMERNQAGGKIVVLT